MIPYNYEPFVDRSVQYPGKRYVTRPDSTVELCQLSRSHDGNNAEGAIYNEGTPLTAQSFNDMLDTIKDTFDSIGTDLAGKQDTLTAGSGIVIQNGVISATGGGGGSSTYLSGLADVGLFAPRSGDVLIFDSTTGKWTNGDIISGTGSGPVVSFADGSDGLPITKLKCSIVAQQSGSGDPSPSNVRPISGFTGLNVTRAGKNLLDSNKTELTYVTTTAQRYAVTFEGAGNYAVSAKTLSESRNVYAKVYSGGTYGTSYTVVSGTTVTTRTFTLNAGDFLIVYSEFSSSSQYERAKEVLATVQVEWGSTATTYEPYTATVIPITWQTQAGTVYGGSLDVTSGVLTVTHVKTTVNDLTIYRTTSYTNPVFYANISGRLLESTFGMADKLKYIGIKSNAQAFSGDSVDYDFAFNSRNEQIYIRADSYSDAPSLKQALGSTEIIYELATPLTVQLTAEEVTTLLGTNNIYCDTGEITELQYYRSEAQEVIDLFQYDTAVKQWVTENFAPLYTEITGTLTAGQSYIILNSPAILTTSTIDIYTDTFGVAPYSIEVQNGNVKLSFVVRSSDLGVKVRIS